MAIEDTLRGTGRTTRLAIRYLEQAINQAGSYIIILDHHDKMNSHRRLTVIVSDLLRALNIAHSLQGNAIKVIPKEVK